MRTAILAEQLRRLHEGAAWHGPSLRELLDGFSREAAERKVGPHSIGELVGHIDFWNRELIAVADGQAYRDVPELEQWPVGEWETMRRDALASGARLADLVAGLEDAALERRIENREYTLEALLHGIAQHTAYHLGQIAWAKKLGA
jgi:uncharacterized damage-inducible protein DinB